MQVCMYVCIYVYICMCIVIYTSFCVNTKNMLSPSDEMFKAVPSSVLVPDPVKVNSPGRLGKGGKFVTKGIVWGSIAFLDMGRREIIPWGKSLHFCSHLKKDNYNGFQLSEDIKKEILSHFLYNQLFKLAYNHFSLTK